MTSQIDDTSEVEGLVKVVREALHAMDLKFEFVDEAQCFNLAFVSNEREIGLQVYCGPSYLTLLAFLENSQIENSPALLKTANDLTWRLPFGNFEVHPRKGLCFKCGNYMSSVPDRDFVEYLVSFVVETFDTEINNIKGRG